MHLVGQYNVIICMITKLPWTPIRSPLQLGHAHCLLTSVTQLEEFMNYRVCKFYTLYMHVYTSSQIQKYTQWYNLEMWVWEQQASLLHGYMCPT